MAKCLSRVKYRMQRELPFITPMECKPVKELAQLDRGPDWQFEIKFDGYRCVAVKSGKEVKLFSRNERAFTQFPNLIEAVRDLKHKRCILDGEIVALDEEGRIDFNLLQNAGRGIQAHFYVFDLIQLNAKALMQAPLAERQRILGESIESTEVLHIAGPLRGDLQTIAAKIAEFGFEGIIAKKCDSIYTPGKAPGTWLKKKIKDTEEFIVGGYIPGPHGVDSIVVGRRRGRDLVFVASVDDGFVPATRKRTLDALQKAPRLEKCPFVNLPENQGRHKFDAQKMRKSVWIKPRFVVELAMNEWTPDGHLRHSEFARLRPELGPNDVAEYPLK
jgi:DNA ligase D-like protein (predicted ligase)